MAYMRRDIPAQLFGTDIDGESIDWCQSKLGHMATFTVNGFWPPLPFADGFFDVIYSISVFTHLPEDMQTAWLAELRRVAKPGGLLLLTVHSPALVPAAAGGRCCHAEGRILLLRTRRHARPAGVLPKRLPR